MGTWHYWEHEESGEIILALVDEDGNATQISRPLKQEDVTQASIDHIVVNMWRVEPIMDGVGNGNCWRVLSPPYPGDRREALRRLTEMSQDMGLYDV